MDATLESRINRALNQVQLSDELRAGLLDVLRDEFEALSKGAQATAAFHRRGFKW